MRQDFWTRDNPAQIMQLYGVLMALGLIVYFLIMYVAGLADVTALRYFNFVFVFVGVYFALIQFKRTHDGHLNYFRALSLGTGASVLATVIFAVFLLVFLLLEKDLMREIQQKDALGPYLNPYMSAFLILIEGVFSGFSVAYLFGNVMQTDKATEPSGGELPTVDWEDEPRQGKSYTVRHTHS